MTCVDCGTKVSGVSEETIAKGSSVRDPGEVVCGSCSSSRVILLRKLDRLPDKLDQIRAKRMVTA